MRFWRRSSGRGSDGLKITADMYTYTAGSTGLTASMPPWVLDGGYRGTLPAGWPIPRQRRQIAHEIRTPTDKWENLYLGAGSPERVLLVDFRSEELRKYLGRTLAEVARRSW
jgi:N-acyl-D-amino-acid deacylase